MATVTETTNKPARSFYVIGGLALLWNLMGVGTYLVFVTMGPEALSEMPEEQRALYADVPLWATSAYAVATWGGLLGSIALLVRKAWAVPVFIASLVGVLVQMTYTLLISPTLEIQGASAAVFPLLLIAIAVFLVWYSVSAKKKGWLR